MHTEHIKISSYPTTNLPENIPLRVKSFNKPCIFAGHYITSLVQQPKKPTRDKDGNIDKNFLNCLRTARIQGEWWPIKKEEYDNYDF